MHLTIRYKKDRKISQALQDHIDKKIEFIEKHLEEDHPVHLLLEESKSGDVAELSFHFHGHDIIAKIAKGTLYEAIDEVVGKCTRQFEKALEKLKHHKGDVSIRNLEPEIP